MTSFLRAHFESDSDPDDEDFDPGKEATAVKDLSEDEDSSDGLSKKVRLAERKKSDNSAGKKKPSLALGRRSGGIILPDSEPEAADKVNPEAETAAAEALAEQQQKSEAEKQEMDSLWSSFLGDVKPAKPKPKPKTSATATATTATSLKSGVQKKPRPAVATKRPLDMDDLFNLSKASTSSGSGSSAVTNSSPQVTKSIVSSIFDSISSDGAVSSPKPNHEEPAAEQARSDTITVTKVYDFAGQNVEVTKEVSKDSAEAKRFLKAQSSTDSSTKKKSSLDGIMQVISGKKPKLGTLEKSQLDWNEFVQEQGIKEELDTFNKGKNGFVENQMFLERVDVRRFELERQARHHSRKPLA